MIERFANLPAVEHFPGRGPMLANSLGHFVSVATISPADLLEHEMVYLITDYGQELRGYMARFLARSRNDLAGFDALLMQDYGIDAGARSRKGNRTYTSFDGLRRVEVKMQDRKSFGPALEQARAGLDEMIDRQSEGASTILTTLVNLAFGVGDKDGKVDVAALMSLRRHNFDDPAWPKIRDAIDDATRIEGTKEYLRLFTRDKQDAAWEPVKLDLAAITPRPEDFDLPSPRRQVEHARAVLAEALDDLLAGRGVGAGTLLAGLLVNLGGGDRTAEVEAWADGLGARADVAA